MQVISWFENRDKTRPASFLNFDVESFYSSISLELVHRALSWSRLKTTVSNIESDIIIESCKSLLFTQDGIWMKTDSGLHDITMGSFSGAEICEMIGLYMLSRLRRENINAIIYRDDGAVMSYKTPRANHLEIIKIKTKFRRKV